MSKDEPTSIITYENINKNCHWTQGYRQSFGGRKSGIHGVWLWEKVLAGLIGGCVWRG